MVSYYIDLTVCQIGNFVVTLYKASLHLENKTTFKDIQAFIRDYKRLFKAAMKASRYGNYFKLEISRSVYGDEDFIKKDFDFWGFTGINKNESGVYLIPDTRYTEGSRDLYLTKNFFDSLGSI